MKQNKTKGCNELAKNLCEPGGIWCDVPSRSSPNMPCAATTPTIAPTTCAVSTRVRHAIGCHAVAPRPWPPPVLNGRRNASHGQDNRDKRGSGCDCIREERAIATLPPLSRSPMIPEPTSCRQQACRPQSLSDVPTTGNVRNNLLFAKHDSLRGSTTLFLVQHSAYKNPRSSCSARVLAEVPRKERAPLPPVHESLMLELFQMMRER